jgi:nucleoid DNA-binding protein
MKIFQKIKNISYLQRLDADIDLLAKKHEIDKEELKQTIDHFFMTMSEFIQDERMPKIFIKNLGTFKPTPGKINQILRKAFKQYRENKIPREQLVKKIKETWPVKQRLIQERNGEVTWKEWRKKKL